MNITQIKILIEIISEIVGTDGMSWQEKSSLINEEMNEQAKLDFDEFISWFD